jgi:eukaryotic-like serine/threonine-protein kinase
MAVVELALGRPEDEREDYLRSACGTNSELFDQAWKYVQAEGRMKGFLLDPLYPRAEWDHPCEPGQVLIGRFRILREVAQGGMGIVYEAMDEKLERRVAIKCARAGFRKQLPPEVRHAREISHPNVCKIFEIHTASTEQGEIDFIVMEFLEGETLAQRLRREPLPKPEARAIALQLCAGLSEAHRNNVIHGDLKSNNVILTTHADGSVRAVIMDFGLARRPGVSGLCRSSAPLGGTPDYMAPELWRGTRATVASDIYALGVILWELASGLSPSDLPVTSSTLSWEERLTWKPPPGRGKWGRVVANCLDPDPAQRFHSSDEVAEALNPSHTRRWFLGIAATVLLTLGSGMVIYQRATAPPETVRLAVLPFASSDDSSLSESLLRGTRTQIARLRGSKHTKFTFVSAGKDARTDTPDKSLAAIGVTHVLRGILERQHNGITLRAYLTDVRSGVNAKEWVEAYKPQELGYAPVALTGVVTETLHLPPLPEAQSVNAAARQDYLAGLAAVRRDSSVDAALARFERAVAEDPDSPLTYAGLAEAQWAKYSVTDDKRWLDAAVESVRLAEIRDPDLAEVHCAAGLLKKDAGWYAQAVWEYSRAVELDPNNSDAYRRLGEAYEGENRLAEALGAYQKAVETDPRQYMSYANLGVFYLSRASYEDAVEYFKKAAELAPDEFLVHLYLGVTYQDLGQFASAEDELRLSNRLKETPLALHNLGIVQIYEEKHREAIANILRALYSGPQKYTRWMNLGTAYRLAGFKSKSQRAYRRGLDLAETEMANNPESGHVRADVAYLCAQLGDRRRARSEIAQALQQSPNDADTRWMAAVTYEALGRRDDTLSVLAKSPVGVIRDVSRWPDVADLRKDSRFLQLLASRADK